MTPKLDVNGVSFSYHTLEGETLALSDISFSLSPGEFAAVVGPSGCGKSTLLSLLCGLSNPDTGQILLDGHPLRQSPSDTGYMLQKDHLFPWRDILSNVSLGLEIQNRLTPKTTARLKEMLSAYGLEGFEHARPSELSGGMRQRAALIRTLLPDPQLLLLDEPFSALDYQTRLTVSDDIGQIIRQSGKTALLVTHDLSEAVSLSDRVIVLTNRPANVRCEIPIFFKLEQDTPLNRRNAPEFKHYFNQIWKELNHDN